MRLSFLRGHERRTVSLSPSLDLRSAMQTMNDSGRTLLLVVDGERLVGVLADGDVRRHLTSGGKLEDPVAAAANTQPTTLQATAPATDVRAFMVQRGLEFLPLLDGDTIEALCVLERSPRSTDMSAVIMAGGLGTRLSPLTDNCPKPLLQVGGKPILTHIIEHLRDQGVRRFALSVNYLSHLIVDYYNDGSRWDTFIDYLHETKRLGTGGALSLLDPEALSDPFVCLNGDAITDVDIGALRDAHVSNGWDATMVVRDFHYTVPYGVVETDAAGTFMQTAEKPTVSFNINAGIYMLSKSALSAVPDDQMYDMPTLFEDLPSLGLSGGTYVHRGRWLDIGSMSEYHRATEILEAGQHET